MNVEYTYARNGDPTIRIDGRYLHSRYDPRREATRFAERFPPDDPGGVLILIGDGTGVLYSVFSERFPNMRVISLEPLSPEHPYRTHHCALRADRVFIGMDTPEAKAYRVRSRLHPVEIARIQTITWSGAVTALPGWTESVQRGVLDMIRDVQAEMATVASFGRLWVSNALRQTVASNVRSEVQFSGTALIAAAAGPGLESLRRRIPREKRRHVPIVAASSALHWLTCHGFSPLLTVHTDGGIWAHRYLRDAVDEHSIIALPLRAGPHRLHQPMLVRSGSLVDKLAPDHRDWPSATDQPTVGASLVRFAHDVNPGATILTVGLDLCTRGLHSHGRPHRNDRFIRQQRNRLRTEETIRAERAGFGGDCRRFTGHDGSSAWQSRTLRAYQKPLRDLFREHRKTGRLAILERSPVWRDEPSDTEPSIEELCSHRFSVQTIPRPPQWERRHHAETVLRAQKQRIMDAEERTLFPRGDGDNHVDLDYLLYLSPVKTLQWYRGELPFQNVQEEFESTLNRLLLLLERFR